MSDAAVALAPLDCALCGAHELSTLHRQRFVEADRALTPWHYDVLCCNRCGFVFSRSPELANKLERHYEDSGRYGYHSDVRREEPDALRELHRRVCIRIDDALRKSHGDGRFRLRIAEAGCATGHLLHQLSQMGYQNVFGIEPSKECAAIARERYGLTIEQCRLQDYHGEPVNVLLMLGVLEHLEYPAEALAHAHELLADKGMLLLLVPDLAGFSNRPNEPFHELSVEHINYFTEFSLDQLVQRQGFDAQFSVSMTVPFYDSAAILGWWRKQPRTREIYDRWRFDPSGRNAMAEYVIASKAAHRRFCDLIDTLVERDEPLTLWGVGSLTFRLLASTRLTDANIVGIVDTNPALQGRSVGPYVISKPDVLRESDSTVLIMSVVYADEIGRSLAAMDHRGKVVRIGELYAV